MSLNNLCRYRLLLVGNPIEYVASGLVKYSSELCGMKSVLRSGFAEYGKGLAIENNTPLYFFVHDSTSARSLESHLFPKQIRSPQ
jgi:hypothetical protein